MIPFRKTAAFLLIASVTAMSAQTMVSASEDIPGTYYGADTAQEELQTPETQSSPSGSRIMSVEEYQEENDAIGVPKSRVEQSPALRYDGFIMGDNENDENIDLEDAAAADEDARMANTNVANARIDDPNNTDPNLKLDSASSPEVEAAGEDGKETAVTTNHENPDTGRMNNALPLAAAAILLAGAVPVLGRKGK